MIMVDHQIREAVRVGTLGIENFVEEGIQPASYDMRIGDRLYSATASEPDRPINLALNGHAYRIPPYGQVVVVAGQEIARGRPNFLRQIPQSRSASCRTSCARFA